MAKIKVKNEDTSTKLFNFRMDEVMIKNLSKIAAKNGLSSSFVVRKLIKKFLNNEIDLTILSK